MVVTSLTARRVEEKEVGDINRHPRLHWLSEFRSVGVCVANAAFAESKPLSGAFTGGIVARAGAGW